jgi:hypothetical protein
MVCAQWRRKIFFKISSYELKSSVWEGEITGRALLKLGDMGHTFPGKLKKGGICNATLSGSN